MKEQFARLSSGERRFVVGVLLLMFILLNALFVWPRFSEWDQMKFRLTKARNKLDTYKTAIEEKSKYEKQVAEMEREGLTVPPENQAVDFLNAIQSEAARSGVSIVRLTPQNTRTNDVFFVEQAQSLSAQSGEQQLVDFLYNLGSGKSLTRVRALTLRRDPSGHQLAANVTLVASYQKNPTSRAAAPAPAPAAAAPAPAAPKSTAPKSAPQSAPAAKKATTTAKKP